jgi:radical SAM protein with 4Fe4S-binding SPASM domain
MFGGSVGTSMDVPNDHRRLRNGSTERYTQAWLQAVTSAREAGLKVSAIAVIHAGTLRISGEEFLRFFADRARIDDVQVNLPFPGGPGEGGGTLEPQALSRFLEDLLDAWVRRYIGRGLRLAPFADLIDHHRGRPARLPCIWQPNCASQFVAIDARGDAALCDCWVASYPQHGFGNVFRASLAELLGGSQARRAFLDRPGRLVDGEDCGACPHLSLCHGGCPVRAFSATGTIDAKDPYCEVYKTVFARCRDAAATLARQDGTVVTAG